MLDIFVVFLPLIGSVMAGIIVFVQAADKEKQHSLDMLAQWVTCSGLMLPMICAIVVFNDVALEGNARTTELFTWIDSGALEAMSLWEVVVAGTAS